MSISNATIKSIAKNILKENYITSAIVSVITISTFFIFVNVAGLFGWAFGDAASMAVLVLLLLLLLAPLCVGVLRHFWRQSCGVRDNPKGIFYFFSTKSLYFKALSLAFSLLFRILLIYLIFSIPVFVARLISGTWLYSFLDISIPIWTVDFSNITNFLRGLVIVVTLFSSFRYFLAPMIFIANEDMKVSQIIRASVAISKTSFHDFLFFLFSLSGWILLSMLVIPLILTIPYILTSYLVYSSYTVSAFNENILKNSQGGVPTFVAGV